MEQIDTSTPKKAGSNVWIGVGYLLAVLGGFIGLFIGLNYRSEKYNDQTRRHGLYILIIGSIIMALGKVALSQR